jgi:hypothetical protein
LYGFGNIWQKLGCGWVSGLCASLTCYPMDTVKRQLMLEGSLTVIATNSRNRSQLNGATATPLKLWGRIGRCVSRMYAQGGWRLFYRGCAINAINSGPSAAITFVANDVLREMLASH